MGAEIQRILPEAEGGCCNGLSHLIEWWSMADVVAMYCESLAGRYATSSLSPELQTNSRSSSFMKD